MAMAMAVGTSGLVGASRQHNGLRNSMASVPRGLGPAKLHLRCTRRLTSLVRASQNGRPEFDDKNNKNKNEVRGTITIAHLPAASARITDTWALQLVTAPTLNLGLLFLKLYVGEKGSVDWDKAWESFPKPKVQAQGLWRRLLSAFDVNMEQYVSRRPTHSRFPVSEETDPTRKTERRALDAWTDPKFTYAGVGVVVGLFVYMVVVGPPPS